MSPRMGALAAVVFWGISFVATKYTVGQVSPVTLVFTRSGLGVVLIGLVLARRGERIVPPRSSWGWLLAMGLVGVFVHQLVQAYALRLTSASSTGWLVGLTPLWSALLASVVLRERFGAAKVAGLAAGFAGAVLVVTRGRLEASVLALPTTRGDLLVLASTVNWAVYSVLGHPVIRRLGPARATAGALLAGWLAATPLFIGGSGWHDYARLSAGGWAALLFLGIACSGLGYLFWYRALEALEASRVASLLYLEPLVTLTTAALLLGERIEAMTVVGGMLLLGGVILVQRAPGTSGGTSN